MRPATSNISFRSSLSDSSAATSVAKALRRSALRADSTNARLTASDRVSPEASRRASARWASSFRRMEMARAIPRLYHTLSYRV